MEIASLTRWYESWQKSTLDDDFFEKHELEDTNFLGVWDGYKYWADNSSIWRSKR